MKFSIVIPSATNSSGLRACLESVIKHTDLSDAEILVIANGAPEETRELLATFPVTSIWFPEMIGYTHACNVGMQAAKGDYFILLNDDVVILGNHWLNLLHQPFVEDELMAVTGPLMLNAPECDREFLVFFCVMISREVTESIGLLDEIFNPGYAEDCDFCLRAVDHGWKIQQVPPSQAMLIDKGCEDLPQWKRDKMWSNPFPCFHDGNQTFGKDPKFEGLIKRNSAILAERYGPKVQQLNTWRAKTIDGWFGEDEIDWLAGQVAQLPNGARVLEVGSWHGRSSRAIADSLPEDAQLWCVDTWIGSSGEPEMHGSAHHERGDHAHQWWWCNLQEHINAGRVVPVRMHSDNAAHTISHLIDKGQMEKFDLIFIDGDHSEEGIRTDIEAWLPLLKLGGLMCGHDYYKENEGPYWVHVRQYVEQRFPQVEKAATSIWHVRPHLGFEPPEPGRGKVFDCFLFNAELDLLEIRLATLYNSVDYFILAEGTRTHSGHPKPLHFELNRERFAPYLDKIRHVVVNDWPADTGNIYADAWAKERWQRDAVMHGLYDAQPNDVVIIGDADEIAHPDAVAAYKASDGLVRLKQRMFYYYLNCENKDGWDWQKIAPYWLVKERTPCGVRYPPAGEVPLVEGGGWHFSFLSSTTEGVIDKIRSYSHQEFNRQEVIDGVESAREQGVDLFGRDLKYEFIEIDDSYPQYVKEHRQELTMKGLIHSNLPVLTNAPNLSTRHWTVTACVSTKDRYTTTLPMCLAAIINQTRLPDKLKIYDDGEQKDLRSFAPFDGLLTLATDKGIDWEVVHTPRLGQVSNHQHCLDNATTQFIWRIDDDEIPEPNCLEELLNTIRDYERGGSAEKVGAVGGLVHHPGAVSPLPQGVDGSLNDIAMGLNLSWFNWNGGPRKVDHLYSTFLLQVDAARKAGGYPRNLSKVGHREESILTHSIKRAGYDLLCTPWTKTYHLRQESGGIRSGTHAAMWEHDEHEWQRLLKTWDVVQSETKLVVADYGLGDHLILKGIWPELRRKFPERRWTLALCFPEVFRDEDVTVISIADAKLLVGGKYDDYSLYRWCWDNNWKGSMVDAMTEFYSK
jgi:beta-1,4-mannosyl-glycoprotein beta-1,4-N-acetylglucosaminyltransferase